MNPYAFTNLTNPSVLPDWRLVQSGRQGVETGYSLSRAVYRLVSYLDRFTSRGER